MLSLCLFARFRTEAHGDVVARFNERFILSLGGCGSALVLDDELNVSPGRNTSKNDFLTPHGVSTLLESPHLHAPLRRGDASGERACVYVCVGVLPCPAVVLNSGLCLGVKVLPISSSARGMLQTLEKQAEVPHPPSRTDWTRRVPHRVLIGHLDVLPLPSTLSSQLARP
jgi:hypothetical protein